MFDFKRNLSLASLTVTWRMYPLLQSLACITFVPLCTCCLTYSYLLVCLYFWPLFVHTVPSIHLRTDRHTVCGTAKSGPGTCTALRAGFPVAPSALSLGGGAFVALRAANSRWLAFTSFDEMFLVQSSNSLISSMHMALIPCGQRPYQPIWTFVPDFADVGRYIYPML